MVNSSRHEPAKPPYPFAPRDPIIYMHIFAGENDDAVIRTRIHEKIQVDFFCAEPVYVLYITGKNVKKCKVYTHSRIFRVDLLLHLDKV